MKTTRNKSKSERTSKSARVSKSGGADRMDRIGDLIHRSLSRILQEEFKDPRVGMITISGVEVTRDLAHAKVFITVFDQDKSNESKKTEETLKILNQASGFFRSQLATLLKLRVTPKPRFVFDDSVLRGSRISSLLYEQDDNPENTTED